MDILEMMKMNHFQAKKMINALEPKAESVAQATVLMAQQLALEVLVHVQSEVKVLTSACQKYNKNFAEFASETHVENELIEKALKELLHTKPGKDGQFKAVLSEVKDLLEHHEELEEDSDLFPKMQEMFTPDQLEAMGALMTETKETIRPRVLAQLQSA